jgi:hypothetical protein
MEKLTPEEMIIYHLNTWRDAKISWTKEDVKDLERLYKGKAPVWAFEKSKAGN